ncbi:unnamed protein product [Arabis nemorensis]|uniref:Uncharacterized protein n=1 Tax=Arabis nemorensis TaxID=586526 RepID=A0A565BTU5_9BRAS|nr:unnamed protein product [Arabis nemorensis]
MAPRSPPELRTFTGFIYRSPPQRAFRRKILLSNHSVQKIVTKTIKILHLFPKQLSLERQSNQLHNHLNFFSDLLSDQRVQIYHN